MRLGGVDDDTLARMIREVETREDALDGGAVGPEPEPAGDPCPNCGEPTQRPGECNVCGEPGCLPSEEGWVPGHGDPCLTLCSRCAREIHLACGAEDQAGNLRCPTCAY